MVAWQQGDRIFVPSSKIEALAEHPTAFYATTVVEVEGKKLKVNIPGGNISEWIGSSLCHRNVGILILTIGDLETEHVLLDPLAKSVLQFCRLLADDGAVRHYKVRSLAELRYIWLREQVLYSHVILVGHGTANSLLFRTDGEVLPGKLAEMTYVRPASKKTFISLCCKTGYQSFGGIFSKATICEHFIAPFHSVHGAVASQFCQSFLAYHFLDGETVGVAFRHARQATPGGASFRLWENGSMKAGQK
ncbi:hypothetical protein MMZ06_06955 [Burkholderia gladioli]|uniref:hypothetical protein n=1 Tax=Burkholderia gladioli TaxID=28095 RepID=UPI0016416155|nr:hypothetical protein [Burkholderia gladioli]MCH7269559.1 hypothetical protein [Burkholderia gladioli]